MKRYVIVGIAIVAILGIAISMALINNTALADKADDNGSFLFNGTELSTATESIDESVDKQAIEAAAPAMAIDEVDVVGEMAVPSNGPGDNFIDEDGDGICDDCNNCIDEDGDGICDDCDNEPGTGVGDHNGNGNGAEVFIDEDGDGVCDDCGTALADGAGNQYGRQSANSDQSSGNGSQSETSNGGGNRRGGNGGQGNRGGQGTSTP